jgi:flagellar hook-associated protein 1 FlgK
MSGLFSSLSISLSGMNASQVGLDTTGQNISNTNTKGYSRKVVQLASKQYSEIPGTVGTTAVFGGVGVEDLYRARNLFLDAQYRTQNSLFEYAKVNSEFTVTMNNLLGEPSDSNLSAKLNNFFQAANDLAANPHLTTAKNVFVNGGVALADTFNQIDQSILLLKQAVDEQPNGRILVAIDTLNTKLNLLADTHAQIMSQRAAGQDVSSLEDTRDLLLDEISGLLDLNIERDSNGQFSRLSMDVNASEAKVTGSTAFGNYDAAIVPAITTGAANNTLTLSINNGNGNVTGPFIVTFDDNSSIRDVVNKINQTFTAAGGKGTIASLDTTDKLVIETSLVKDALNNTTASVNVVGGTAVAGLGLAVGAVSGSNATKLSILDNQGLHYKFKPEQGDLNVSTYAAKLSVVENTPLETKVGYVHNFKGSVGALYDTTNVDISEMREELSQFAMNIKDAVNSLLTLGITSSGNQGAPLFIGNDASNFAVDQNVIANNNLISQGKSGAASDGAIATEIADLFFGSNAILSDGSKANKIYIDSPSTSAARSSLPVIPGQSISINVKGIIDDNGSLVNAGTNNMGGGSLVQIQFLNAAGAVIGGNINFPASGGPPLDKVTYTGTVPVGAAFVQFVMNGVTFNDNNLTNNTGHFGISIQQGTDNILSTNFNDAFSGIVGDFGNKGKLAQQKLDSASSLNASIDNNRQSVSGVSLEEEAANLIMYQNAFSANARVMSVVNETLQSILNIV